MVAYFYAYQFVESEYSNINIIIIIISNILPSETENRYEVGKANNVRFNFLMYAFTIYKVILLMLSITCEARMIKVSILITRV